MNFLWNYVNHALCKSHNPTCGFVEKRYFYHQAHCKLTVKQANTRHPTMTLKTQPNMEPWLPKEVQDMSPTQDASVPTIASCGETRCLVWFTPIKIATKSLIWSRRFSRFSRINRNGTFQVLVEFEIALRLRLRQLCWVPLSWHLLVFCRIYSSLSVGTPAGPGKHICGFSMGSVSLHGDEKNTGDCLCKNP